MGQVVASGKCPLLSAAACLCLCLGALSIAGHSFHSTGDRAATHESGHTGARRILNDCHNTAAVAVLAPANQPQKQLHIPRTLHQTFIRPPVEPRVPVSQIMRHEALQRDAYFRKEWWTSCKVHNPGWTYKLWDYESAVELISSKYPQFLDIWKTLPKHTMQSDLLRAMVLQTYGGVYLDTDTECFKPMESLLLGYHLVATAECNHKTMLNIAQSASIPQHPFWEIVLADISQQLSAGNRDPITATGPMLVTRAFKKAANISSPLQLVGEHQLHLNSSNSSLEVTTAMMYSVGSWFLPCHQRDRDCLRAAAAEPHKFRDPSSPVAGAHHFSSTWVRRKSHFSSLAKIHSHMAPAANFLTNSTHFVEARCLQQLYLPAKEDTALNGSTTTSSSNNSSNNSRSGANNSSSSSSNQAVAPSTADAYHSRPVCWDIIQQEVQNGSCVVFSFKEVPLAARAEHVEPQQTHADLEASFGFELSLADAGCHVHLFTNAQLPASILSAGRIEVTRLLLRPVPDPFHPLLPADTLDNIMAVTQHSRLTLLLIQNMGRLWEVGSQLYLSNSQALAATQMLLLEFFEPLPSQLHQVYTFYQHVYQEAGMLGYAKDVLNSSLASSPAAVRAWRHHMQHQQQLGHSRSTFLDGEAPTPALYRLGFRSKLAARKL